MHCQTVTKKDACITRPKFNKLKTHLGSDSAIPETGATRNLVDRLPLIICHLFLHYSYYYSIIIIIVVLDAYSSETMNCIEKLKLYIHIVKKNLLPCDDCTLMHSMLRKRFLCVFIVLVHCGAMFARMKHAI